MQAGAAAQGSHCGSAAMGASASVVLNNLMGGDPGKMTATEKENRKNLVASLVTGIAATAGTSNIAAAANAAAMEAQNNALFIHNNNVVAYDKQDNNKVVVLNDKDAKKLGVVDYEVSGLGGIPIVSDKTIEQLKDSNVYDLNNPRDFNALRKGTDMGYYPSPTEGDSGTRVYFQNGMNNNLQDAQKTASLISEIIGTSVGVIANNTHGIANDTTEYLNIPQTKDVLNEYTYRKLDQSGTPKLIVMHSAGNNDAMQALTLGKLYSHQYPNLSFYSLGSPMGNNALNQAISNARGTYLGQNNDWRDPVTYSKTSGATIIGGTGAGLYLGVVNGCAAGAFGGPLGCFAGGAVGGAVGAGLTGGAVLYGLSKYHPMTNYLDKSQVVQTLQQWQFNNKP